MRIMRAIREAKDMPAIAPPEIPVRCISKGGG